MSKTQKGALSALDAPTFAATMGNAVWLMTMSKAHKDLPIRSIEKTVATPTLLRRFRLYSKEKQPVALTWANVSGEVKARVEAGNTDLDIRDWTSGEHIVIVDCVSPFNPPELFREKFLSSLSKAGDEQKRTHS
ncbi:toxin-activating lysine-acyltransferase [Ruegeria sp. ANG-R]|uniref:toxin-activating lysine-acyltransferase n=1 Tax=Ruegeria sp. ANG-R TaxID=1577903 RepID=UPI00068A371D|nr:toxin-activating lysine-acyltransferase [Ruegeria sp. ANG-R]